MEVIDAKHRQGGKNESVTLVSRPVTYDGTTVIGVPGEGKATATAVVYRDENDKFVTEYGTENIIQKSHIEMVKVSDAKYVKLSVSRGFYYKSVSSQILHYVLALPTLGYSLMLPHEWYSENIYLFQDALGQLSNRFTADEISENFANGRDIDVLIMVRNVGNMDVKQPFIISDTLPNYMLFKGAKYYTNGGVAKVTFDNHNMGNNQNLVFKVYPNERGLGEYRDVVIKISTSPNVAKFLNEYKYAN